MHCGLWVHYMRSEFHATGATYAAVPGAVMAVGQVYHALRQLGGLPDEKKWEDMEKFMEMQGNSTFFVGDPPTSLEGYSKNWMMYMGMSTTNWAPNKRTDKLDLSKATRRNMKFMGWASLLMQNRHRENRPMSTEVVLDILQTAKDRTISQSKKGKGKAGASKGSHDVVPTELVRRLAETIHAEAPELRFDYFALHGACWALLQRLRRGYEEAAGAGAMAMAIPQPDKLPHLVGYVFSGMQPPNGAPVPQSVLWQAAIKATQEGLDSGEIGGQLAEAAVTPAKVDAKQKVRLDLTGLSDDPWKLNSGSLLEFTKGMAEDSEQCPMQ